MTNVDHKLKKSRHFSDNDVLSNRNKKFDWVATKTTKSKQTPSEIMNQRYLKTVAEFYCFDYNQVLCRIECDQRTITSFAPDCSQNAFLTMIMTQDVVIGNYTKRESVIVTAEARE